ncbi:hypothetical protein PISL3812_05269 [Talaromyces islandicus]|uniref:Protein kinase domain-containing protein n=1 Tax=Talaromyces islandicus TaxID=28573 RepID=A0A0U1LZV0_TALIS|nr:hypothetical protein PISL3812_05269 [Talaromyces islandicus]
MSPETESAETKKRSTMIEAKTLRVPSSETIPPPPDIPSVPDTNDPVDRKRKRTLSPIHEDNAPSGLPRLPDFTKGASFQNRSHPILKTRDQSPWKTYQKEFTCDLAGDAAMVFNRAEPSRTFALRHYLECFHTEGSIYALCEDLPITLEDVVACDAFLNEARLAAILKQVLDGLSYLMAEGFEHGSLKCSNILMGMDGTVRIGCLEAIHRRHDSQVQTLTALRAMTVELMEKRPIYDSVTGVTDLARWPLESDAVKFLAATTSADSIDHLRKEPLIVKHGDSKGTLVILARLAIATTTTYYSYP